MMGEIATDIARGISWVVVKIGGPIAKYFLGWAIGIAIIVGTLAIVSN